MQTKTEPAVIGSTVTATLMNSIGNVEMTVTGSVIGYEHNTDDAEDDESYMKIVCSDGRRHSIACDPASGWKFEIV